MNVSLALPRVLLRRAITQVPRRSLVFVRLDLPGLSRGQLSGAVRLQLTQYLPSAPFGFVCRSQGGGQVAAWAWVIDGDAPSPRRSGGGWPESALDEPANGLRVVRRSEGFEAQQWLDSGLAHSRWFAAAPTAAEWQQFVRGCGADPEQHPLPQASAARAMQHPGRGWLRGDNLPVPAPFLSWRWYVGVLLLGALAAAALGMHLQARQQLQQDSQRLRDLRIGREASLQARTRYEQAARELESLQVLAPRLAQLELLDRISQSGVFAPQAPVVERPPAAVPGGAPGTALAAAGPASVKLVDWDVRGGQLKMTLELPERQIALLDITRRLEAVPGLGPLRVGQDGGGNTLTLAASVAELAPTASAEPPRPPLFRR